MSDLSKMEVRTRPYLSCISGCPWRGRGGGFTFPGNIANFFLHLYASRKRKKVIPCNRRDAVLLRRDFSVAYKARQVSQFCLLSGDIRPIYWTILDSSRSRSNSLSLPSGSSPDSFRNSRFAPFCSAARQASWSWASELGFPCTIAMRCAQFSIVSYDSKPFPLSRNDTRFHFRRSDEDSRKLQEMAVTLNNKAATKVGFVGFGLRDKPYTYFSTEIFDMEFGSKRTLRSVSRLNHWTWLCCPTWPGPVGGVLRLWQLLWGE